MADPPDDLSALGAALADVRAVLADMVGAADAQHVALLAGDLARLEQVTRAQEVLAARLERAERRRLRLAAGTSLREIAAAQPVPHGADLAALVGTIARAILELRERHARNAALLQRSADLAGQSLQFLQRLVAEHAQPYGADGAPVVRQSLLVDGRA